MCCVQVSMPSNIEIKAFLNNRSGVEATAARLSDAGPGAFVRAHDLCRSRLGNRPVSRGFENYCPAKCA